MQLFFAVGVPSQNVQAELIQLSISVFLLLQLDANSHIIPNFRESIPAAYLTCLVSLSFDLLLFPNIQENIPFLSSPELQTLSFRSCHPQHGHVRVAQPAAAAAMTPELELVRSLAWNGPTASRCWKFTTRKSC